MNSSQLHKLIYIKTRLNLLSATAWVVHDSLQHKDFCETDGIELVVKNLAYEIHEQKEQLGKLIEQLSELRQGVTA